MVYVAGVVAGVVPPRRRAPIQTHANGGAGSSPPGAAPLVWCASLLMPASAAPPGAGRGGRPPADHVPLKPGGE